MEPSYSRVSVYRFMAEILVQGKKKKNIENTFIKLGERNSIQITRNNIGKIEIIKIEKEYI